jgi:hypothetical protein
VSSRLEQRLSAEERARVAWRRYDDACVGIARALKDMPIFKEEHVRRELSASAAELLIELREAVRDAAKAEGEAVDERRVSRVEQRAWSLWNRRGWRAVLGLRRDAELWEAAAKRLAHEAFKLARLFEDVAEFERTRT